MSTRRLIASPPSSWRRVGAVSVVRPSISAKLLGAIDHAAESRWEAAQQHARSLVGTRDERVEALTTAMRRELGVAGAAAGGTAAIPGVGLMTVSAAFLVELGWSTVRLADLVLTIAAIHGHDRAGIEERRTWVLSILGHRDGAANVITKLVGELAETSGRGGMRRLSERSLRQLNTALGHSVITRYGSRRGMAAAGRVVPFGVGAVLGYGLNARAITTTAGHAHGFFCEFPIALDAIDVEPRRAT